jgi:predicted Fe-Mo cluster-binding NifX family protein
MRVAVSSQGQNSDDLVDPRFGRAQWLIVTDTDKEGWLPIDNGEALNAEGGAGVLTGTTVVEQGAKAVITGNVGPNALKVLAAARIPVYAAPGGVTVRQAVEALTRNELPVVEAPTVQGHWR